MAKEAQSDSTSPDERQRSQISENSPAQEFHSRVRQLAKQLGLVVTEFDNAKLYPQRIQIGFAPHFPMWVSIDVDSEAGTGVLVGMVRTYGLPGDRSDYHDLLSLIWAAMLRSLNFASVRLVDIPHPVIEGELYGRYVLFERQPPATYISLANPDYEIIKRVLHASASAAHFFSRLFGMLGGDHEAEKYDREAGQAWASKVARQLRLRTDHREALYNQRHNPEWSYYRRNDWGVVAFDLGLPLVSMLPVDILQSNSTVLESVGGQLIDSGTIKNVISRESIRILSKVICAYGDHIEPSLNNQLLSDSVLLLPIESHLICVTSGGIVSLERECGYRAFSQERDTLRKRHQAESRILSDRPLLAQYLSSHISPRMAWSPRAQGKLFLSIIEIGLPLNSKQHGQWSFASVRRPGNAIPTLL